MVLELFIFIVPSHHKVAVVCGLGLQTHSQNLDIEISGKISKHLGKSFDILNNI